MTAKEMFDELGYIEAIRNSTDICSVSKKGHHLRFDGVNKVLWNDHAFLTLEEIKAIIQQCKELGWLDD